MAGMVVESPVWRIELDIRSQDDLVSLVEDIADDARRGCPIDTLELHNSIDTAYTPGVGYVKVGTDHWAPVEYGAVDHIIRPRRPGGRLRFFWLKVGRWVSFRRVYHPGNPAQPFMRPALYRRRKPRTVLP